MSVATVTPFQRSKRLYEDENLDSSSSANRHIAASKRARFVCSAATGRCTPISASETPALLALLSAFPEMDEKTVSTVLLECGNNIDAAIKRLGDLRLSSDLAQQNAHVETSAPLPEGPASPTSTSQHQEHQQQQQQRATGEQWVEHLVTEMSAAKDLQDARVRAGSILQNFESFVTSRVKSDEAKGAASASRVTELQKENAILKRAVQIQNGKLQEKAHQDQEVAQLRQLLAQYQEQLRALELTNYSLSLHLSRATNGSSMASPHQGPDVF